jgi:hypothetical protein
MLHIGAKRNCGISLPRNSSEFSSQQKTVRPARSFIKTYKCLIYLASSFQKITNTVGGGSVLGKRKVERQVKVINKNLAIFFLYVLPLNYFMVLGVSVNLLICETGSTEIL